MIICKRCLGRLEFINGRLCTAPRASTYDYEMTLGKWIIYSMYFSVSAVQKKSSERFVCVALISWLDTTKPTTQPRLWLKAKLAIILETTWNFAYVASFLNDRHCKNVI